MMQSGGIKGVLREAARDAIGGPDPDDDETLKAVFGPPVTNAGDYAGALVVSDARILLFPVRSLKGVYALVTCPSVLRRYAEDQRLTGRTARAVPANQAPGLNPAEGWCTDNDLLFFPTSSSEAPRQAVLGDMAITHAENQVWQELAAEISDVAGDQAARVVVVADDVFTWFVRFHTEVIARNSLDSRTKCVKRGALWNEEYLPAQAVMYSVLLAQRVYSGVDVDVLGQTTEWIGDKTLQFGGDASTGKGLCAVAIYAPDGGGSDAEHH